MNKAMIKARVLIEGNGSSHKWEVGSGRRRVYFSIYFNTVTLQSSCTPAGSRLVGISSDM